MIIQVQYKTEHDTDVKSFDVTNLLDFVDKFEEWKGADCIYNDEIISINLKKSIVELIK